MNRADPFFLVWQQDGGAPSDGGKKTWTRRMAVEDAAALSFKTLKVRDL